MFLWVCKHLWNDPVFYWWCRLGTYEEQDRWWRSYASGKVQRSELNRFIFKIKKKWRSDKLKKPPLFLDAGYFMYFNIGTGNPLQSALLESRTLYPKRKLQCLQFFYKITGSSQDKLVIWTKMDDGTGTVRRMKKIHTFYGKQWLCFTVKCLISAEMGKLIRFDGKVKGSTSNQTTIVKVY